MARTADGRGAKPGRHFCCDERLRGRAMMVNIHSRKFLRCSGNCRPRHSFSSVRNNDWRGTMRKFVLAAVAAMAVAVPTFASATEFGVRIGGDRDYYRDRDYR